MRFYIGITDQEWYSYLSQLTSLSEVNFWQPSPSKSFHVLQPGELFLFKLHSPNDYIVGGGLFSHFTVLPTSLAWKAFGDKNGAEAEDIMRRRIERYRRINSDTQEDYEIGCILLQTPFFFDRKDWIPVIEWSKPIVRGKSFDATEEPGKSLFESVMAALTSKEAPIILPDLAPVFGKPLTILPRLGQGSFRILVTDAYNRRCALSQSPVLHVLDAAHVKPVSRGGVHSVDNGILLRQDFHTLFDRGYITVTPDYYIEISRKLREEFHNGKEYYKLHGEKILSPSKSEWCPSAENLTWHNSEIFLG